MFSLKSASPIFSISPKKDRILPQKPPDHIFLPECKDIEGVCFVFFIDHMVLAGGTPLSLGSPTVSKVSLHLQNLGKYLYTASLHVIRWLLLGKGLSDQTKVPTPSYWRMADPTLLFCDVTDLFPPSFTSTTAHSRGNSH